MSESADLQRVSQEFQKLQSEYSTTVEARQKLEAQLSENEFVKKEFDRLTPKSLVFKQIGPVLVKQDQSDAKQNVETRLDFIRSEIKRMEAQLKEIETKTEQKKKEIVAIQSNLQHQPQ